MFTEAGQSADFSVEFTDEFGAPLDPASLTWCIEDFTHLRLDASGMSGTVNTTGFELGSVDLVVRDPESLAEARAPLVFADLQDDAHLIEDDLVLEGQTPPLGETRVVRMNRTTYSAGAGSGRCDCDR